MADILTVNIEGLAELEAKLTKLDKTLAGDVVFDALRTGGKIFREAAVALAPSDTGFLTEHFNVTAGYDSASDQPRAWIAPQGKIDYPLYSGGYKRRKKKINGEWKTVETTTGRISVHSVCRFLEFGTSKMIARPFLTQAFAETESRILDEIVKEISAALDAVTR
jgi:HK97 gp10 family phage protein